MAPRAGATLVELGRATLAPGEPDAVPLLERAYDAGSVEARLLLGREIPSPAECWVAACGVCEPAALKV